MKLLQVNIKIVLLLVEIRKGVRKLKKVLILTAENTGHGHKSITQSLCEQFVLLKYPLEVHEVDSFTLGGKLMEFAGNLYNIIAVKTPWLWKLLYQTTNLQPKFLNYIVSLMIKDKLLKLIKDTNPDIIVSLHAGFVGSVINVLEGKNIKIPLITYVADFDNVTRLWADKRSLYTICPTENSKRTIIKEGIKEDRIRVLGFPARERFNKYSIENEELEFAACTKEAKPIKFLIMNGSQGTKKSLKMSEVLLNNFDCNVTIMAGRNKELKALLENKLFPKYKDRVTILSFVENVEHYMLESDILILRASPNVVTEAVNLCRPIIVTGSLLGQEEKNPQFVVDNNLGIVCRKINNLPSAVNTLLADNGRKLNDIYLSQLKYRRPQAAKDIARFIFSNINSQE